MKYIELIESFFCAFKQEDLIPNEISVDIVHDSGF